MVGVGLSLLLLSSRPIRESIVKGRWALVVVVGCVNPDGEAGDEGGRGCKFGGGFVSCIVVEAC